MTSHSRTTQLFNKLTLVVADLFVRIANFIAVKDYAYQKAEVTRGAVYRER